MFTLVDQEYRCQLKLQHGIVTFLHFQIKYVWQHQFVHYELSYCYTE